MGMTETAAVVAVQQPKDFLTGKPPYATPLPHAKITLGKGGRIKIRAKSLFCGLLSGAAQTRGVCRRRILGKWVPAEEFCHLRALDRIINTGGEKVNPDDLERQIRATGLVKKCVWSACRMRCGVKVVALYVGPKQSAAKFRKA